MTVKDIKDLTSFKWATVTAIGPLRVKLDGDTAALLLTPDNLAGTLAVNDRVRVELTERKIVVHGKAGGNGYNKAELDGGQLDTRYYTEAEINAFRSLDRGLVPVAPTSVAVTAGSASIVGNKVILTAAAAPQFRGIFTSAYRRYRIFWRLPRITGTANYLFFRWLTGTTIITTAQYYGAYTSAQGGTISDNDTNPAPPSSFATIGYSTITSGNRSGVGGLLEIDNPLGGIAGASTDEFAAMYGEGHYSAVNHTKFISRSIYNGTPAFDGFQLSTVTTPGNLWTGEVAFYAYA